MSLTTGRTAGGHAMPSMPASSAGPAGPCRWGLPLPLLTDPPLLRVPHLQVPTRPLAMAAAGGGSFLVAAAGLAPSAGLVAEETLTLTRLDVDRLIPHLHSIKVGATSLTSQFG